MSALQRTWRGVALASTVAMIATLGGCGSSDSADRVGVPGPDSGPTLDNGGFGGAAGNGSPTGMEGTGGTGAAGGEFGGAGGGGGSSGIPGPEFTDNPVDVLVADPNRSAWQELTAGDVGGALSYKSLALQCYQTPSSCTTTGCEAFATCCVNNGTCCKAVQDSPLPPEIDFQSCAGTNVDACVSGMFGTTVAAFGPNEPVIVDRGLIPSGTSSSEGGARIGDPTDLGTTRARVDVEFTLPIGCGGSCLESAGVTFSSADPGAFVDAQLGLLLSGSRSEVNLVVENTVVDSFDAGNTGTRWTLVASPEGRVEVLRDGITQTVDTFDPNTLREASLVLFGRNLSEDQASAAIRRVEFEAAFCDIPSAWESRDPVTVTDDLDVVLPDERFGRAPTLASDGGETRVAYELGNDVFWSREIDVARVQQLSSLPVLSPSEPHDIGGLRDPELVFDGSVWHLFYTALDAEGTGTIGHAVSDLAGLILTKDTGPTLALAADEVSLDAPTVYQRDGLWVLVVRATLADGSTELRVHYATALELDWERIRDGALEGLTRVDDPGSEITDPSLIVHNSGYQLYFARRAGTRWSIDALASDELLIWRSLGESLGPADDDAAFDRLGGRAPDALGLVDRIDLVYEGQNGVTFELGWASRPAPWDTAPAF